MMLPQKYLTLYEIYLDDWMRAEEVLKLVERLKNEAFIPSIKELRYASRRVVEAQNLFRLHGVNASEKEIHTHLVEAIENCRKARHDALDSAVNFTQDQLDKLINAVGLDTVAAGFPGYLKLKPKLREVSQLIIQSRKDRVQLDDKYEKIKRDHLEEIVNLYVEMETSFAVIAAIETRRRKEFWKAVIVGGVIVGLLVGCGVVILDKRGAFDGFKSAAHEASNDTKAEKKRPAASQ